MTPMSMPPSTEDPAWSVIVIDGDGRIQSAADLCYWRSLSAAHDPTELRRFAVENMGFVEIERRKARPHIRLRPRVLSAKAFSSLLYWLFDTRQEGAMLSTLEDQWHHEIFGDAGALTRRLIGLSYVAKDWETRRFLSTAIGPEKLDRSVELLVLFASWQSGALRSASAAASLCDHYLGGRYTLVEACPSGELIVRGMGRGYRSYNASYISQSVGKRLADDPDDAFGQWVAESYRQVAATGAPRIDEVDALRLGPQKTTHRVCYRRVILPLATEDPSRLLISASVIDDSLSLRDRAA